MPAGTLFGAELRVHPLLALILVGAAAAGYLREALVVFGSLLAHELAHLAAARGFQVRVERIELYPFGGVARVGGIDTLDPPVEALVALAGPLSSLLLMAAGQWMVAGPLDPQLLGLFLQVNSLLALVNLIPALPLDGGRIAQAYLRMRIGDREALRVLTLYGYGAAGAMVLGGLVSLAFAVPQPNLFVLAVFVFLGARREWAAREYAYLRPLWGRRAELARRGALPVMTLAAPADMPLLEVLRRLAPRHYHVVWVLEDDLRPRGMLVEADLREAAEAGLHREQLGRLLRNRS